MEIVDRRGNVVALAFAHEDKSALVVGGTWRLVADQSCIRGGDNRSKRHPSGAQVKSQPNTERHHSPFGLTIAGLASTVTTSTLPATLLSPLAVTLATWLRAIFWVMADFCRPVPAALAPAFWTKNTSSVGGYLCVSMRWGLHEQKDNAPCDSLVEEGITVRLCEEGEGRVGPDDGVELLVVDMEGFVLEALEGVAGGDELLRSARPLGRRRYEGGGGPEGGARQRRQR